MSAREEHIEAIFGVIRELEDSIAFLRTCDAHGEGNIAMVAQMVGREPRPGSPAADAAEQIVIMAASARDALRAGQATVDALRECINRM